MGVLLRAQWHFRRRLVEGAGGGGRAGRRRSYQTGNRRHRKRSRLFGRAHWRRRATLVDRHAREVEGIRLIDFAGKVGEILGTLPVRNGGGARAQPQAGARPEGARLGHRRFGSHLLRRLPREDARVGPREVRGGARGDVQVLAAVCQRHAAGLRSLRAVAQTRQLLAARARELQGRRTGSRGKHRRCSGRRGSRNRWRQLGVGADARQR
mmetsp:Transcript_116647/g.371074  ORF Transcript_116647/g.371074 Transcript_116647/m.371074 type:complete len:210 (+) Transcript_116647:1678-2307(+)